MPRSVFRYKKVAKDDSILMEALEELVKSIRRLVFGSYTGFAEKDISVIINDCTGYISCKS
jgi:hypothetical protein